MILSRGSVTLKFFPHPEIDPTKSWFSCCLRLNDVQEFYSTCLSIGVPEMGQGAPRLHPTVHEGELEIGALIDPEGTLLRLIQNG